MLVLAVLDLGALFSEEDVWASSAEFFAVEHAKDGFVFTDERRDAVNCLHHDTCSWHGLRVWETRVYFGKETGGGVRRVEMSLFNRGDARGERFGSDSLKRAVAVVAGGFGVPLKELKVEKTTLRNGAERRVCRFDRASPRGELVWGLSAEIDGPREIEYLRLALEPAGRAVPRPAARAAGRVNMAKIRANVTKGPNGDVFIENVPMVDQGRKGYCAAAAAERVLRYYGHSIDEHEVAQQAGTLAEGGTSVEAMRRAVTGIGEKNGLGFQNIISMSSGIGELADEVERYNKAAKAERKPPISLGDFTRGNVIYVSEMRAAMDVKVVYRMRQKDSRMKKFSVGVRRQVNAGIPVFWGVELGIFPERGVNPQTSGGHMRLIIGYNDKRKEILFTDTWGEGHELKRMPEDWAFTITHDAFFIKPR